MPTELTRNIFTVRTYDCDMQGDENWSYVYDTVQSGKCVVLAVPWLRRLVAGLSPRRPEFDPGSVRVGFVVDKVTLEQVFPLRSSVFLVTYIPPVLHYTEKWKKLIISVSGLHSKPQGCGASVASAAGPFATKKCAVLIWNVAARPDWAASPRRQQHESLTTFVRMLFLTSCSATP
jgi:hypothetical protein